MRTPVVDRAEAYLLAQSAPLLMGDICEGLGLTRGFSATLTDKLRVHLGAKLIEDPRSWTNGRTRTYFSIVGAVGSRPVRGFKPPADLYRGWRNPKTGITGARLGFDPS